MTSASCCQTSLQTRRNTCAGCCKGIVGLGASSLHHLETQIELKFLGDPLQEIAGALEASFASPTAASSQSQPQSEAAAGLALQPSRCLVQGLQQCCSRQVCLAPLTDRFLRLLLQLLTRYASWLHDGLQARSHQPNAPSPAEPSDQVGSSTADAVAESQFRAES